ncbi:MULTISPECIES: endo-1,4-beta-xylanase [unclassified Modicisalibacter]|uniref:endo-1,4-beta-xylanase n=1 Tax=unclassified Modicisalibacter TaxID=2679913 RepID=UPI001CCF7022|nr:MULTISPECIES: endo-1,4-beta-xylanase [unclassified Modicisalibacter]MBZ9557217.1 endo-1,4-beta-xylanase [Modicisalibacter sp. R2A 31.J]MBZ9574069.1 endo-1,4-beta-xylanase [Modicisalibacter sp. MOD 31.J]
MGGSRTLSGRFGWLTTLAGMALCAWGAADAAGPDAAASRGAASGGIDLLQYDWSHLDGATPSVAGVRIDGLGWGIVPPADEPDEPVIDNPPINLRGPALQVTGDFAVSARVRLPAGASAYLTLYGRPPLIQDEWRQEGEAVTLALSKDRLRVELQDGIGRSRHHEYPVAVGEKARVTLSRVGRQLVVDVDGRTVARVDDPGLFDSGRVLFGAHGDVGEDFWLTGLSAQPLTASADVSVDDSPLPRVSPPADSLRALAARNVPHLAIGTAVAAIPLVSDPNYARVLARQYSMVTPENAMKFQFVHPRPDRYAFAEADAIVDFAERNHMAVHGHTLAWGEALPRWLTRGDYSDGQIREILAGHIATVVGRYKGRVASWDVINEPLEPFGPDLRRDSPWYRAMGADYIAFALRAAHRADPDAKLYINEFACESRNAKSDALYRLARSLLARGVPLDGIGFQLHEDMTDDYDPVTAAAFRDNVQRFIDLGLAVRISEMDVNLHDDDSPERLRAQADYYRSMLELARDIPAFTAFSTWGFTDRYSSLQEWWDADGLGNGLIFDPELQPKPAYRALQAALAR